MLTGCMHIWGDYWAAHTPCEIVILLSYEADNQLPKMGEMSIALHVGLHHHSPPVLRDDGFLRMFS